jgi:isoleucyl-tRNA synthetase
LWPAALEPYYFLALCANAENMEVGAPTDLKHVLDRYILAKTNGVAT